jgi:transcriptional regulator with PAS, ATPase and Fis domain
MTSSTRISGSGASGRQQSLTVEQIKDALAATINNVTKTAAPLGVTRKTIHGLHK